MSAYIVSDETITAIVEGLRKFDLDLFCHYHRFSPRTDFQVVGRKLLEQNYRSVNARYGEDTETPTFTPAYLGQQQDYTLEQIYGAIRCYRYQACETDDWLNSPMERTLLFLESIIANELLTKTGYVFPWGIKPLVPNA